MLAGTKSLLRLPEHSQPLDASIYDRMDRCTVLFYAFLSFDSLGSSFFPSCFDSCVILGVIWTFSSNTNNE
jgi:hypothetical protein